MAIKTELSRAELEEACRAWNLGALSSARGLPEGSINTLYVLETASGRHVLRLSEGRSEAEVRYETALLAYLDAHRYPSVRLVPHPDGALSSVIRERFACVFHWATGEVLPAARWTPEHAWDAGRLLGRLHVLTEDFPQKLANRYAPGQIAQWVGELAEESAHAERAADPDLWDALPLFQREAAALADLPTSAEGTIHADWFPDNLHFLGDRASAVLDFEMACRGPFVLDLAIALHACCYLDDYVEARTRALVAGYQSERRLSKAEREVFHPWARFAALRFAITRVRDFHRAPLAADKLFKKDWRRFRDRLQRTIDLGPEGWAQLCGLE